MTNNIKLMFWKTKYFNFKINTLKLVEICSTALLYAGPFLFAPTVAELIEHSVHLDHLVWDVHTEEKRTLMLVDGCDVAWPHLQLLIAMYKLLHTLLQQLDTNFGCKPHPKDILARDPAELEGVQDTIFPMGTSWPSNLSSFHPYRSSGGGKWRGAGSGASSGVSTGSRSGGRGGQRYPPAPSTSRWQKGKGSNAKQFCEYFSDKFELLIL